MVLHFQINPKEKQEPQVPNLHNAKNLINLGWIEGASILIAVALVSNVNAINNYQKDKQFRALEKEKDNENVFAIRDGQVVQVQNTSFTPFLIPRYELSTS